MGQKCILLDFCALEFFLLTYLSVCIYVCMKIQFVDYGSERIVDISCLFVLPPQFRSLMRQGVRCCVSSAADAGGEGLLSHGSLEDQLVNKVVVIQVVSRTDEDSCQVTFPLCDHNQQLFPQFARCREFSLLSVGAISTTETIMTIIFS